MISIFSEGNYGIQNIEETKLGNPGVGGTEYLLLQLFYYLSQYEPELDPVFLTTDSALKGKNIIEVKGEDDVLPVMKKMGSELLIFIPKDRSEHFFTQLEKENIDSIAWVHNYLSYQVMNRLEKCKAVKRIIFVGRQHYDAYFDAGFLYKADYIYNMVNKENYQFIPAENKKNIVTYVGGLNKTKGFHKLASVWKQILKNVPDAQLYVIGSGNLYSKDAKMGMLGIADEKYERQVRKYLSAKEGKVLESVHFMGRMGREKEQIIRQTKVGVANPTGKSETFCLSAVEFKQYGVPVVTYRGKGLLDTVHDGEDGILIRSHRQLRNGIVMLLQDNALNTKLGDNGFQNGSTKFTPEVVIKEWHRVIDEVQQNLSPAIHVPDSFWRDDWKWLKYGNYCIRKRVGGNWKSVAYYVSYWKEKAKVVLKHIKK